MRLHEEVDEVPIHGVVVDRDLLVALRVGARRGGQFQAIEHALARQRVANVTRAPTRRPRGIRRAGQHREERIGTQGVMIIQILVAEREPIHPLRDQGRHRMLDPGRRAIIGEARGKPRHNPRRALHLAQQHGAPIRRQRAPIKTSHHVVPLRRVKMQGVGHTLCRHNGCLRDRQ